MTSSWRPGLTSGPFMSTPVLVLRSYGDGGPSTTLLTTLHQARFGPFQAIEIRQASCLPRGAGGRGPGRAAVAAGRAGRP